MENSNSPSRLQYNTDMADPPISRSQDNVTTQLEPNGSELYSAEDRSHAFRNLVSGIADNLDKKDINHINWQCKLPSSLQGDQTALDVLRYLHRRNLFNERNVKPLAQLLKDIFREDLIEQVKAFESKFGHINERHSSMPAHVSRPIRHMSHYTRPFGTRSHTFSPGANTLTVGTYRPLVHPGISSGVPLSIGKTNNHEGLLRSLTTCPPISESEPMQGPAPPYYSHSPGFPRLLSDGYLYGSHSPANLHPPLNKRFSAPVTREMLSASSRSLHEFNSPRIAHSNAWIFASNPPSRNDSHESLHNLNDKANIPATSFPYGISGLVNLRQHSHTSLSSLPTTAHDYQHHVRPNALDTSMSAGLREGYFYHFHCKCGHTICVPMQPPGTTAYPKAELAKQSSNGDSPGKDMENGVRGEYAKQVERQLSSGDKVPPKDVHHTTKNIQPENLFVNKFVSNQQPSRSREDSLQEGNESLTKSQADTKSHTSSTDTLDDGKPQSLGAAANISHQLKRKRTSFLVKPRAKQVEPNKFIWPIKREKLNKYIYKHTSRLLTCKSKLELIPPNDKIRGPLPKLCLQLHPYGTEEDDNRCVTAKVMIEHPKTKCQLHSDTMIEFVISAREGDAHSGAEIGRIRTKQKLVTQSHFYVKGIITHKSLKKSSSDYVQIEATVTITQDS